MEDHDKPQAAEPDIYPLDDAAIESIAELDQQERQVNIARNAILGYILRQHKLPGNWTLAENRRELIRAQPQMQMQPQP